MATSALATRVPEGALVTNPLIEIWNPLVTILPFGLFIFTNAALALGQRGAPAARAIFARVLGADARLLRAARNALVRWSRRLGRLAA